MAESTKGQQQPKKASARLETGHLGHGEYRREDEPTAKPPQNEEDWGQDPADKREEEEEGEEEELQTQPQTAVAGEAREPAAAEEPPVGGVGDFLNMLGQLQQQAKAAQSTVEEKIAEVEKDIQEKQRQKEQLQDQLDKVRQWVGGMPGNSAAGTARTRSRRPSRRRKPASGDGTTTTARRGSSSRSRRSRPQNDRTLKDCITEVLTKRGRANLRTITEDIEKSGYKTTSKKFTNTVRVQLYRLDDEGQIRINDDGTYSLRGRG